MVINIPEVQPFEFQASTAFDERVQLANKLNEVIDALNLVGDIPDMQTEIDTLKQNVASLQESIGSTDTNLATVEGNLNKVISDLNALTAKVGTMETTISGIQSDITAIEGDISGLDSEVEGLKAEVVDEVSMASTSHGSVQVTIHHEDGTQDTSAPIDLALVQEGGITLQTGATDRSFNLKVTLSDGSSWQTNDFVIPEGGGTDVSVTSIQISQGTSANQIRVKIGLSDGSFINSNDWTVVTPAEFGTLQTTVEGNTGDITSLDSRVQALEDSPGYTLRPATATTLGGVKIGAGIVVQSDGTISVDKTQIDTAAVASTVMFTADASKVTLHADSVAGSEFTEDIPQASQGGAGTIDHASYAKIAATESKVNALSPTVTVNEDVSPAQITVAINGKSSTANLPNSKSNWEKVNLDNFPNDFVAGEYLMVSLYGYNTTGDPSSWNEPPTNVGFTPVTTSNNGYFIVKLEESNQNLNIIDFARLDEEGIALTIIKILTGAETFNTSVCFRIHYYIFNGAGLATQFHQVSRSEIKQWCHEMFRLRP